MTDPPPAPRARTAARWYHGLVGLLVVASLVLQLVITLRTGTLPVPTRLLRFLSFFTVQSNLLVAAGVLTLAVRPDRDGRGWRVLRLDGLLGITVTGLVYVAVLAPLQELAGASRLADTGLHYLSPLLALVGWLVFGPRPRVDGRVVVLAMVWPVLWFAYTLVHGALSGWYPYPFIDVTSIGYWSALRNAVFVTLLLFGVAGAYAWGDGWLRPWPAAAAQARGRGNGSGGVVGEWVVVELDGAPLGGPGSTVEATLALAADDTVAGSSGVNRLRGTYSYDGVTLTVGPLATTRMAGPPQAMDAEARLLSLLSEPLAVEGDGDVLGLTAGARSLRLRRATTP